MNTPASVAAAVLLAVAAADAPARPLLGVYQGAGCDGLARLTEFARWFGREPDLVVDFYSSVSWQEMKGSADWILDCWSAAGKRVVFSIPMLPGDATGTLAEGAAGKFDEVYRHLAEELVQHGYGSATIRLGWEFNGDWMPWAARKDPASWVAYWRRIVVTMRAVGGAKFRFDWCLALDSQGISPEPLYPGDEYVDIIGMDVYNESWTGGGLTREARWRELLERPYGLRWHREFARRRGKPESFPEWGTGVRPGHPGVGGGDDAYFIERMSRWIGAGSVVYHGYWDYPAPDYSAKLSDGRQPRAGSAFRRAFARR